MLNHGLLFQVYGEGAAWQFLGWILVFTCLVLANEIARRTKAGGMLCFVVLPIILTVYFIAIYVSAAAGAEWALICTYDKLVPLCEVICSYSWMYWFYDAQIQMGYW